MTAFKKVHKEEVRGSFLGYTWYTFSKDWQVSNFSPNLERCVCTQPNLKVSYADWVCKVQLLRREQQV